MKEKIIVTIALAALAFPAANALGQEAPELAAAEAEAARAGAEAARVEAEVAAASVLEEAEAVRAEAQSARREAERVAKRASEAVRARDESRRAARVAHTEATERERAVQQEEIDRAREELSRAHRELREAQREVARAHRELARDETYRYTTRVVNLGDKPVIGIVLGEDTEDGVKLTGISPDGPAELAGLKAGDVLVAINNTALTGDEGLGRAQVFKTMETVKAGDTVVLDVLRDDTEMSIAVVAEVREPSSWQSLVRIPEVSTVERVEGIPGDRRIVIESTVVPEIDEEALAERMEILSERLKDTEIRLHVESMRAPEALAHELHEGNLHEFYFQDDFSDFAGHAFGSANVWFGLPSTHGLKLAAINEGLGDYFKTDRGVLVLNAKDGNAYELQSGDVILKVGDTEVATPSDLVRALRDVDPGEAIEFEIKRDRRNKTLTVTVPENRLGFRTP